MAARKETIQELGRLTRKELLELGALAKLRNRSVLKKDELISALSRTAGIEKLIDRWRREDLDTEAAAAQERPREQGWRRKVFRAPPAARGERGGDESPGPAGGDESAGRQGGSGTGPAPSAAAAHGPAPQNHARREAQADAARESAPAPAAAGRTLRGAAPAAAREETAARVQPAPAPGEAASADRGAPPCAEAGVPFSEAEVGIMAVDPACVWAFWEADQRALALARRSLGDETAALVLRFHDVPALDCDPGRAAQTFEVTVSEMVGNYYYRLPAPGKTLVAELGARSGDDRFFRLARSNWVELPREGEAAAYEDRRRRVHGFANEIWRPRSGPVSAYAEARTPAADAALACAAEDAEGAWAAPPAPRRGRAAVEGAGERASPGVPGRPVILVPAGDWKSAIGLSSEELARWSIAARGALDGDGRLELTIGAEIIIHGRTRPDAEVVIGGVPAAVRPDGTFELRFEIPCGTPELAPAPREDA